MPSFAGAPTIAGSGEVGTSVTLDYNGGLTGTPPVETQIRWLRRIGSGSWTDWVSFSPLSSNTDSPTITADITQVRAQLRARDADTTPAWTNSAQTNTITVVTAVAPSFSTAPTISGTGLTPGNEATITAFGGITGTSPLTNQAQWQRRDSTNTWSVWTTWETLSSNLVSPTIPDGTTGVRAQLRSQNVVNAPAWETSAVSNVLGVTTPPRDLMASTPSSGHFSRLWLCETDLDNITPPESRFVNGTNFFEVTNIRLLPSFGEEPAVENYPVFGQRYSTPVVTQGMLRPMQFEVNYTTTQWNEVASRLFPVVQGREALVAICLSGVPTPPTKLGIRNAGFPIYFGRALFTGLAITPSTTDAVLATFSCYPTKAWSLYIHTT